MINPERQKLIDDIRDSIATKSDQTDILQTTARLIAAFSHAYHWCGFYMAQADGLHVGPYVGPETQHTRIEFDQGICGAAYTNRKTLIIPNVNNDPRHIACSLATKSELVAPILDEGRCLGLIDIDSDREGHFGQDDQEMFDSIARLLADRLRALT
jgi:GAF domain-containing protein